MPVSRKKISIIIILLLFFLGIGALSLYMLRAPILIVTDLSFNRLYGPERLTRQRGLTAFTLFRRVIPVYVAESAGPDLIAIAVEESFDLPAAVFFPQRYSEGAAIFAENNPDILIFVMGGPESHIEEPFIRVRTDEMLDFYRAGLAAAPIAGEQGVLFFSDGVLADEYRDAFRAGLEEAGHTGDPGFANATANFTAFSDIGCVIVAGPAIRFLEANLDIPIILFSWIDPGFTPNTVKVIFDDSHWTLAGRAFRNAAGVFSGNAASNEEELLFGSVPVVLRNRLPRNDFRLIRRHVMTNRVYQPDT
ncbi:MAG: hypothetical protein FWG77_01305 [Treponema sp.]|nr:hypothetical protein [Treponema sp.]